METLMRLLFLGTAIASLGFLLRAFGRSIKEQRRSGESVKEGFGLSIALLFLFLTAWLGHALSEWQVYSATQEEHGQPVEISGYLDEFAQSTLENWQSEYLQLFAFVVLAALYIHRGSAESRDGEDEIMEMLKRIESKLDGQHEKAETG